MDTKRIGWKIVLAAALCAVVAAAQGQAAAGAATYAAAGRSLSEPELEQMVAPIALYPDDLIVHVLRAATHPAELAEANRWVTRAGAAAATENADAAGQSWNSSVKALVAVPQVLAMMAGDPAWTEALGRAYLTQEPALLGAIQVLRRRAEAAGNLQSNAQQQVASDGGDIVIDPAEPGSLAVPYYDPNQVYGSWPWTDYPPMTPFSSFGDFGFWGPAIAFETVIIVGSHWHRHHVDWRRHRVDSAAWRPPTAAIGAAAASRASAPSRVAPPVNTATVPQQQRWQAAPVSGGFAHIERAPESHERHPWSGRDLRRSFPAAATPAPAVPVRPFAVPRAAAEPVRRGPDFEFRAPRPSFQMPRSAATFTPAPPRGSFHAEESHGGGRWRR